MAQRLIDAHKLLEELRELCRWHAETVREFSFLQRIIRILHEQPTIDIDDVPQWIPCSERLPEEKGEYLVTYHPCYWDDVKDEIRVGIDTFRGRTTWAKKKHQRVIAWMPLPKPYEVDK